MDPTAAPTDSPKTPRPPEYDAAIGAFLVIPLYTIMFGLVLVSLIWQNWSSLGGAAKNVHMWKFAAFVFVCLIGFSIRSLECAAVISDNPFRAFAMGRYIFGIFLAANLCLTAYSQWPTSRLEASPTAVLRANDTHVLLDATKTSFTEIGWLDFGVFLLDLAFNAVESIAVLLFLVAGYKSLRGAQPEYQWDHFVHDITFGWKGKEYKSAAAT